jgi:hypothetical protein
VSKKKKNEMDRLPLHAGFRRWFGLAWMTMASCRFVPLGVCLGFGRPDQSVKCGWLHGVMMIDAARGRKPVVSRRGEKGFEKSLMLVITFSLLNVLVNSISMPSQ